MKTLLALLLLIPSLSWGKSLDLECYDKFSSHEFSFVFRDKLFSDSKLSIHFNDGNYIEYKLLDENDVHMFFKSTYDNLSDKDNREFLNLKKKAREFREIVFNKRNYSLENRSKYNNSFICYKNKRR